MTTEELDRLERIVQATESEDEWGRGRSALTWTPAATDRPARVWHDDGDSCAEVDGNLGLGFSADRWAEFFATFSPPVVAALLAELRQLRDIPQLDRPAGGE